MAKAPKIRGKTPTGVTLAELVSGLKNQNMEIPDNVKTLIAESRPKKTIIKTAQDAFDRANAAYDQANTANVIATEAVTQTANSNTTANTVTSEPTTKPADSKKKGNKHSKGVLIGLVGKNNAAKLMRKQAESVESHGGKESADVKQIKADIEEIKALLLKKSDPKKEYRPPIRTKSRFKQFASGFVRGAMGNSPYTNKVDSFLFDRKSKAKKTEKTELKAADSAKRIPVANVPQEVDHAKEQVINEDQQKVLRVKEQDKQEEASKTVHNKLDKILEMLDKMKRKDNGTGALAALLASQIGKVLRYMKTIGEWLLKGVTAFVRKIGTWLAKQFVTAFSFLKKLGGKVGRAAAGAVEALGVGGLVAGGAAAAITGGTVYGLQKMADNQYQKGLDQFKPLEDKYGLKALGNGDFALKGKTYKSTELPEAYQHLIGSVVDPRGGAAKRDQQYIKDHSAEYKALELPKPMKAVPTAVPKQAPKRLAQASSENTQMKSTQESEPQVIVVKGSNKNIVVPQQQKNAPSISVTTRNPERSYDSLVSGMFDHPAGYGGLSRM